VSDQIVIETVDLRKHYEGQQALDGLNLKVPRGSIYGFLGRNGAGKTTTIKVLLGMCRPTSGRAAVLGRPAGDRSESVEIRRRTGYVSEEKDLYDSLTVAEMIRFTAGFFPRWKSEMEQRYLKRFDLPLSRKVSALSKGMRTKLALLVTLCRGSELLILDEPTSGLDPAMAEEVLQAIVSNVARDETTVFFSSHQLSEVDQIADYVGIVDRGRMVVSGALEDLREQYRRVQFVFDGEAPQPVFRSPGVERVRRSGRMLTVLSSAGSDRLVEEARALQPVSVDVLPVTLKEIFLETVAAEE
jgi:ABC-2 type transport system ATP-binding protein